MNNPKNNPTAEFEADFENDGYHIFSREKNKIKDFYPNKFSVNELIPIEALKTNDKITIRAFFAISKNPVWHGFAVFERSSPPFAPAASHGNNCRVAMWPGAVRQTGTDGINCPEAGGHG